MRTGAERTKSQSMRDRRDESYGAFGKRPNQRINRGSGGGVKEDAIASAKKDMGEKHKAPLSPDYEMEYKGSNLPNKNTDMPHIFVMVETPSKKKAKGGVAKNYAHGGVEAADEEGSRLSISMERQEDAGYSPSEADFDKQHSLAEEGIMEVGANVKIIQGYNSPSSLGETDTVRGTGAMVKGTKFRGSF